MSLDIQFVTLISMISMGICFGAAFDTYNRFLVRSKRKAWIVFINDVLFWCIQALLIFYVLYESNYGEWRFYILLALLCGYSAYQALFKHLYKQFLESAIHSVHQTVLFLKRLGVLLLVRPITGLITFIITVIVFFLQLVLKFGNGILALANLLLKALISVVKILFYPFYKTIEWIWGIIPNRLRSPVEKFFYKLAGIGKEVKNSISKLIKKWTTRS